MVVRRAVRLAHDVAHVREVPRPQVRRAARERPVEERVLPAVGRQRERVDVAHEVRLAEAAVLAHGGGRLGLGAGWQINEHGAYGIEDGDLILSDTLELETLDFHELQASMESITLAAASHMEQIKTPIMK